MRGGNFPGGQFSLRTVFFGGNCPGRNYSRGNHPRGQLSGGTSIQGWGGGGIFLRGNCPRTIFKTFSRHFEDVFKTSSRPLAKISSKNIDVSSGSTVLLNLSSRGIQHVSETCCKDDYLQKV